MRKSIELLSFICIGWLATWQIKNEPGKSTWNGLGLEQAIARITITEASENVARDCLDRSARSTITAISTEIQPLSPEIHALKLAENGQMFQCFKFAL